MSHLLPPCPSDEDEATSGPATFWGGRPNFFLGTATLSRSRVRLRDPIDVELLQDAIAERDRAGVLRRYARTWKDHTGEVERVRRR